VIKNDKQLATTRTQLDLLARRRKQLESGGKKDLLVRAQIDALASDMNKLESEITEYQAIRRGKYDLASIAAVVDIGKRLVQARIAANLTQHQLAQMLGQKDQQIQRYERTQYGSASLSVIEKVARILAGTLKESA
jgi:ribosome-binding protein aMBF1 (putative translation factor)